MNCNLKMKKVRKLSVWSNVIPMYSVKIGFIYVKINILGFIYG